jgi:hypothetical protein
MVYYADREKTELIAGFRIIIVFNSPDTVIVTVIDKNKKDD